MMDPAPLCGILVIDKPLRWTSMDVCANIRSRLRRGGAPKRVKVGHAGTLDPLATGVLVVLVGRATRLCDVAMSAEKGYDATIDLAHTSTTDDAEGTLAEVACLRAPTGEEVGQTLTRFVGTIMQRPPAFSAVHVEGRRAYQLARKGQEVALPARPVVVHAIELVRYEFPTLEIRVRCGKGTYIRSLARDIGAALGCGGMLGALRRGRVGDFTITESVPLDSLPEAMTQADLMPVPGSWATRS